MVMKECAETTATTTIAWRVHESAREPIHSYMIAVIILTSTNTSPSAGAGCAVRSWRREVTRSRRHASPSRSSSRSSPPDDDDAAAAAWVATASTAVATSTRT